ncbi:hypothetical protein VU07_03045 [Desulfobulbus sp. F4]|nr:hypothetical protein [Desulfobulbus sp. F3]MCW5200775.1 hypothetical protein [Desulfobulbus sp. F4]
MKKTGKVILVAALAVSIIEMEAANLQAEENPPCKPGFCLLPNKAAEKERLMFETRKAALKNLVSRQAADCALTGEAGNSLTLSAKVAGELFSLRNQIVLKARETGLLLQLPSIVMEFMGSCGLKKDWNQLCGDYGGFLQKFGIPYRKGVLAAPSQES